MVTSRFLKLSEYLLTDMISSFTEFVADRLIPDNSPGMLVLFCIFLMVMSTAYLIQILVFMSAVLLIPPLLVIDFLISVFTTGRKHGTRRVRTQ